MNRKLCAENQALGKRLREAERLLTQDIAEREQAEQELHESDHRFGLAVDNFPGVFIIYDSECRIRFINLPGQILSGRPKSDILGRTDEEIFPPDFYNAYLPIVQRTVETRTVQSAEIAVPLFGGTLVQLVTYVPILGAAGEIRQILGIAQDVTERQKAEEDLYRLNAELEQRIATRTAELAATNQQLRDEILDHAQTEEQMRVSEERFRRIFESDMLSIAFFDLTGRIWDANNAFLAMLGYTRQALGQLEWDQLTPPEWLPVAHQALRDLVAAGSVQPFEQEFIRQDGTRFPIVVGGAMRAGPEREAVAFVLDITERKRAEQALRQANDNLMNWAAELEQRNHEIGLLNEMGDLLQSCLTVEEAYRVIGQSALKLFPNCSGVLFMLDESKDWMENVAVWGNPLLAAAEHVFKPDECWALRRGRIYVVEDAKSRLPCGHFALGNHAPAFSSACIPMMAQGEALGVLSLQYIPAEGEGVTWNEARQRLAVTVAEHVALALSSLKLRETLHNQAIRDSLTGVYNRRYMLESLERELSRAARRQTSVGLIMLDLDHFKKFNDDHGHAIGDVILHDLGRFLQTHIRGEDIAARYGGEEFMLILPDATLEETCRRAEHVRAGIKQVRIQHEGHSYGNISISLGVASYPDHGVTVEELLRVADRALYRAKIEGRDRVVVGA
ncbi:MAG: diguanylate cyclase [Chloroflexi bacterium]|nr:diguanylate cyclase [Chloroflexota bacterium]